MTDETDVFHIMYTCRAMRRLKPDPVPEEVLVKLIDAAHQGPTGSNRQNARWIVVRDARQRSRIAELHRSGADAYLAGTPAAQGMEKIRAAVAWQRDHFDQMPALIVASIALAQRPADSFVAGLGAGGSGWPGVQNLLLAARALGLGATITTFALRDRAALKSVLGLPDLVEPFAVLPVGYPRGRFGPLTRRPLNEVLRWDRW